MYKGYDKKLDVYLINNKYRESLKKLAIKSNKVSNRPRTAIPRYDNNDMLPSLTVKFGVDVMTETNKISSPPITYINQHLNNDDKNLQLNSVIKSLKKYPCEFNPNSHKKLEISELTLNYGNQRILGISNRNKEDYVIRIERLGESPIKSPVSEREDSYSFEQSIVDNIKEDREDFPVNIEEEQGSIHLTKKSSHSEERQTASRPSTGRKNSKSFFVANTEILAYKEIERKVLKSGNFWDNNDHNSNGNKETSLFTLLEKKAIKIQSCYRQYKLKKDSNFRRKNRIYLGWDKDRTNLMFIYSGNEAGDVLYSTVVKIYSLNKMVLYFDNIIITEVFEDKIEVRRSEFGKEIEFIKAKIIKILNEKLFGIKEQVEEDEYGFDDFGEGDKGVDDKHDIEQAIQHFPANTVKHEKEKKVDVSSGNYNNEDEDEDKDDNDGLDADYNFDEDLADDIAEDF